MESLRRSEESHNHTFHWVLRAVSEQSFNTAAQQLARVFISHLLVSQNLSTPLSPSSYPQADNLLIHSEAVWGPLFPTFESPDILASVIEADTF